ncbi:MAG: spondin domain-containing protein [Dokdonia sp.]|nr:spondin domain-containing protein [Dokdonia sp.]
MRTTIQSLAVLLLLAPLSSMGQSEATYEIIFDSNWSQATHPHTSGSLPSQAHWSPFAIAVHNDQVDFLSMGDLASQGIENIAETGNTSVFLQDVNTAITNGTAKEGFQAGDIDDALGSVIFDVVLTEEYPLLTILSMIAPSPDWFVATDGLELFDGTNWTQEIILDVYAYDAGTDTGVDYQSANTDANPPQVISSLQGVTPFSSEKIGSFTVTLSTLLGIEETSLDTKTRIYPNPSTGIFQLQNSTNETLTVTIVNALGQKVFGEGNVRESKVISLADFPTGIYFLYLETPSGSVVTKKLVKQ